MKIMHLLHSDKFSGAENVVCQIIKMFSDKEEYDMLYVSPKGEISETLAEMHINYVGIEKFNIFDIRKIICEQKIDILHAHDVSAGIVGAFASIGTSCKIVSHMHVNHENMTKLNLKTILYGFSTLRYKRIFWVSQSAYDNYIFKNFLGYKSVILNNVISKREVIEKKDKDTNEYNFDICYVGRITYQKNPERLVEVLKGVREYKKDLKVAIVGTGDLLEKVKQSVIDADLKENIHFYGFMSNPLKIMEGSKVMIMTSRFEGLPMSVLEAMALGVPIVSTPVDGLKNVVVIGKTGFLENKNECLVERLVEIINNDELREKLSKRTKEHFDNLMDLDKYKLELKNTYDRILHF